MIPEKVRQRFPPEIRKRGESYFAQSRVELQRKRGTQIRALVFGSFSYRVTIETAGTRWLFRCDCPYAEDNYECKHIWAVLLAADDEGRLPGGPAPRAATPPVKAPEPAWKKSLRLVRRSALPAPEPPAAWPADRRIVYGLELDYLRQTGQLLVAVNAERVPGSAAAPGHFQFTSEAWLNAADAHDRHIAHLLIGARVESAYAVDQSRFHRFIISPAMYETTLRALCDTGRFFLVQDRAALAEPLAWDDGPAWTLKAGLRRHRSDWQLEGSLTRAGIDLPLDAAAEFTQTGLVLFSTSIARFDAAGSGLLLPLLRTPVAPMRVPQRELFDFVAELYRLPDMPAIELPPEAALEQRFPTAVPRLVVAADPKQFALELEATLSFDYDGHIVESRTPGAAIVLAEQRRLLHRQPEMERAALQRLRDLGVRLEKNWRSNKSRLVLLPRQLDAMVETLTAEGWQVEADGKRYRAASNFDLSVSSGIDWFELNGSALFGDQPAGLPQLLAALRKGDRTVVLDDGSLGLLPVQWLKRFAGIADMGSANGQDGIRFTMAQGALLDALLATMPEPRVDETFQRIRAQLRSFDAIAPQGPGPDFSGTLRPYQCEGLGWLAFLRSFGLGGCLADDMGLGKTVQVLALLDQRRAEQAGPALVVVPRSLVFNWKDEAARFAPLLRVRDYTGTQRRQDALDGSEFDVLLTTYGTLRRDAPALRDIEFDYIVLDEAQAIKNAKTASAKAARILRGRNRLALSGTPIENRLEELWSLFDFLNPGMLGASSAFSALKNADRENGGNGGRALIARAVRPFLLRRTKEQVAPELPARVEQTLFVELEPTQRALYNELRDHYRSALLQRVDHIGIKRAKIEILEALLRLRQAACHAALIDSARSNESSAKLDVLSAQLAEIVAEGHKALVFSQFTTFLGLVRDRLDADGIVYEYLDGKTRDRQQRVQRFQADPDCPLFLISLRAGGYGLNLTAADYVFVLDPWWNPAVEAQAIDRTHRIGQERPVFALRLIARDTVEEKVLELQRHKRELADAILGADASVLSAIGRDELEMLLA